ncbi:MAG: rhodanese-like domain-containing protein [Planctomycetaceae bacterium]
MIVTISPHALADLRRRGEHVPLIDVRTPAEFGEVHVLDARNVPLDRIDPTALAAESGPGTIYFICKSGGRSRMACEKMLAAGLTDVVSVEGGTAACDLAGLPVVRGRKTMSLERQVRIAAGMLVVVGAVLAAFGPDANWRAIGAGLAGFVGAGLVFAGVTDTCGMAMLIARMPWNQTGCCTNPTGCAKSVALAAATLLTAGGAVMAAEHTKDSLDTIRAAVASGQAVLIDVRESEEWQEGHVVGAKLLPLSSLESGVPADRLAKVLPKDRIIYCHCLEAADILTALGYDVRPIKQGYPALAKAGFPTATGK